MGGRRYIYSGGARRGRGGRDGGRGGGRGRGRRGGRRGSSNANRYHETVRQGQDVAGGGNACERQDDGRDWRRGGRGYDGRNAPAHNGGLNWRGGHRGILGGGRRGAGDRSGGYGGRWEYRERRPFREPQGQVHETDRVTGDTVLILDSQGNVVKWGSLNINGGGGDQGNIQRAHPGMSATHSSHIVGPPGQILHNTGHERFLVIRVPDRRKWIGDDKKRIAEEDLEEPRQRKYIRTVNERLPRIEAGDASGSAEKGTGSAAQGGAMDVDIVDALSGSPKEVIGSDRLPG
ncbi:hypothetical protein PCL_10036 [Purpureocillium lilacinum]|uniref:Uncharacterized protein n=1 Tax=Purpureocillium lilacinum TaxID=33203 RepID=A0A2U3EES7_PURLI|nr:hypothetical protein PCL_10036 [Purpureocillium lilacinum]